MAKPVSISADHAEMLGIQALTFLASDPERLGQFLAITGIEAQDLRVAAQESGFLLGVLDHIMGHEGELMAFSNEAGVEPATVAAARTALAGTPWERETP